MVKGRQIGAGSWQPAITKQDIDTEIGVLRGNELINTIESYAAMNNWPLATVLVGMKNGNALTGEAEQLWNQEKDARNELFTAKIPPVNEIAEVLLMYLKVRYTFFMLLGRPVSPTNMRALLDTYKLTCNTAGARYRGAMSFIALYVKKAGNTAEGCVSEMDTMVNKTSVGKLYWLAYMKATRARRQSELTIGKVTQPTYAIIRHLLGLVKEEKLEIEGLTKSTGRMHSLQTSGRGGEVDREWQEAMDQLQRQN
jgi:hypothetical protein